MDEDDTKPEPTPEEREMMETIKKNAEEVAEFNKKLDDLYDEHIRKIDLKKKLIPENERVEEEHLTKVQGLREDFEDLKARISAVRRSGKDVFIASVIIKTIPSKIKMAEVTREAKDFEAAKAEIARAAAELAEAEKEEPINVKKEVELRLKEHLQRETGKVADDD